MCFGSVEIRNWCVICTSLLFVLGLLINRLSNNQKHRFRKNPMDPAVSRKVIFVIGYLQANFLL
jgi:hypothetical protein